jgi:hypothetical protein
VNRRGVIVATLAIAAVVLYLADLAGLKPPPRILPSVVLGGAAVVLGALSPRTRNAQVALYQAGEVDHLIATDAIGMGLNMDIGHVTLASLVKFDGRERRRLHAHEIGQIAGRAGRHMRDGTFNTTPEVGGLDTRTVEAVELSVPRTSVCPLALTATLRAGKFWRLFAPASASFASLAVTPAGLRLMPSSAFEWTELERTRCRRRR